MKALRKMNGRSEGELQAELDPARIGESASNRGGRSKSAYAQMLISVYVILGVFLLLAARNPWANGSLIAFTAWSSFSG